MTDRIDYIRDRLTLMLTAEMPAVISSVPRGQWSMEGTGPFGFQWPVLLEDTVVVPVCWDVMAESTAWLPDEALDMYLDIIEYQICRHIVHLTKHGVDDPDERLKIVDDELWDLRPEAASWMLNLQAEMLTGGTP